MFSYFNEFVTTIKDVSSHNELDGPDPCLVMQLEQRLGDLGLSDHDLKRDPRHVIEIRPIDCSVWDGNARHQEPIDVAGCAALIDSIARERGNRAPVLVRRNAQGDGPPYELLIGCRRRFVVDWLNHNGRPEIHLKALLVDLSDEQAFRIADIENRERSDFCELSRALSYRTAVDRFYGGVQSRMAEALEVSNSQLSRLLALGELPAEVIAAFGRKDDIKVRHSEVLTPLLRRDSNRARIIAEAIRINREQEELSAQDDRLLPPSLVLARLRAASGSAEAGDGETGPWSIDCGATRIGTVMLAGNDVQVETRIPAEVDLDEALDAIRAAVELARNAAKPASPTARAEQAV
jgi:ParB family chromosome partitioning protein